MDSLKETLDKPDFDWDAINVGDYQLDHSQNFFAAANKENNRRLSNVNATYLLACPTPQKISTKEELKTEPQELKPEILSTPQKSIETEEPPRDAQDLVQEQQDPPEDHEIKLKSEPQELKPEMPVDQAEEHIVPLIWNEDADEEEEHLTEADQHLVHQAAHPPGVAAKLRLQWTPMAHHHREHAGAAGGGAAGASAALATPKAYQFKALYEGKRQEAMRRRSEEDKKARQFHSRPMPNFRAMHRRMDELVVTHRITVPVTPEAVKPWHGRVHKDQNHQQQERQGQRPGAAGATRFAPFHLRSEQRVRDRREFDAAVQVGQDQKKKEQDEQRKRCEQEEIKEIRKMTLFKARPNPFK
ncbi:MAP7 domain-containing protein 2 [Drosophila takahashii]|uniref:MAP7 domain-containing protein 2 n=1 Tax=Drosophila takahashii TaxID=29030 RepID=UPI001CF7F7D8|nr:uncharacterized protein LOC108063900 [Drosophila takahashii]